MHPTPCHPVKAMSGAPLDHEPPAPSSPRQRMFWIYRGVRVMLGIIFICSGGAKLFNPQNFAVIINAYGLIPEPAVLPAAVGLSILEMVAGAGLLLDVQWSLGIIAGLLLLFTAILSYGLWMGLDVDCGCFGPDDPEGQAYHSLRPALYRDMAMMAGAGYLFFWRRLKSLRPVKFSTLYQIVAKKQRR